MREHEPDSEEQDGFGSWIVFCRCGWSTGPWSTKTAAYKELTAHEDEHGETFQSRRAECFDRSRP